MFVKGSAGTDSTYDANLNAFRKWSIIPRMLVDTTTRSLKVTFYSNVLQYDLLTR